MSKRRFLSYVKIRRAKLCRCCSNATPFQVGVEIRSRLKANSQQVLVWV